MSEAATSTAAGSAASNGKQADLVEAAKGLMELVDRDATAAETLGQLTDEVEEAFHETGLWGMWVPQTLGGAELWPIASLHVLEDTSYADPSAGWVLMAAALATGCDAAYMGDEAAAQLYPGGRLLVHAGQGTRPGQALTTDGGYLVSGEWQFASGIKNSQIIHTGSLVEETGQPRIAIFPKEQATFIDNWDVLGLRATGSIDYTADSVFVPEPFTYPAVTDVPLRGGIVFTLGIVNFGMICHTSWALGVGRRMLDELRKLVEGKAGRPGSLGENEEFLGDFAMAEAKWRAAHALTYETWNDVEDTLHGGDPMTLDQQTRTRLALQHATWSVQEVCMFVYLAAGTAGIREGIIQRAFRDYHTGTQHFTSSPPIRQNCGRMLAGIAKGKKWQFLNLVD